VACVVESLLRFRGQTLIAGMLRRGGRALAICRYRLAGALPLVDLDDPRVLDEAGLRPSQVATRHRDVTQAQARRLYAEHPGAAGLRWWSAFESSWIQLTLWEDRAAAGLDAAAPRPLGLDDPLVVEAAAILGLR
jgi:hypothetical protein